MARMWLLVAVLASAVFSACCYTVNNPEFSVLSPRGLRIAMRDEEGISLVAYHYSINKPLPGVAPGDHNHDVTSKTGNYWVHENTGVDIEIGDVVNYWVYVTYHGLGYQLLEQSWTVPEPTSAPVVPTTAAPAPPATNAPPKTTNPPQQPTDAVTPAPNNPGTTRSSGGGGGPPAQCSSYPCDSSCDMSIPPCNGLIFQDEFDTLDFDKWEHEITAGGGGNWEFQYYTNNRSNSYVKNGVLYIKPTLTSDKYDEGFLTSGTLSLWGASPADLCTGNAYYGCERGGTAANVVNPIQSARLRTVGSFAFKYGRVEVEAKMPTGDWIWPAIWLLPKHNGYGIWPASGEIDLVECRGNRNLVDSNGVSVGVDQMGSTMHWGPFWPYNGYPKTHATKNLSGGKTFGTDFHKYAFDWTAENIKFYVDDELILTVDPGSNGFWEFGDFESDAPGIANPWENSPNKMAPFDQEFYILMNVAVGGTNYFSDGFTNTPPKPWSNDSPTASTDFWNARADWLPTWNQDVNNGEDAAMQVNYVRVYAN